jgi:hypothetical protein
MRDPEASEPFTQEEFDTVLAAAREDPSPHALPTSAFLGYAGAHILVLSGGWRRETTRTPDGPHVEQWYQPPIRSDAIRGGFIYWERPKNSKGIPMELSRHLKDWLGPWLDEPRPLSTRRYEQILERVGKRCRLQVNPMRFRHYCAVRMKLMGLSTNAICRRLGVSPATVVIYVEDPKWVTTQKLDQGGW